jgi:hypothetical protein
MTLEPLYRITFSYREAYRAGPGERVVLDVSALHWKPLPDEPGYDHGET